MPIDPRIALGVQPLQVADPMARYSQMAGIQNAQNQNALAQYQLSAAQRADEQQNKLYAAAQQPDFKLDFQSAIQYGAPGIAAFKAQQEASNARTEGQIKDTKLLTDKLSLLPEAYKRADTPEAYLALHQSIHADPVLGPYLKSVGATPEKGLTTLQNAIQTGNFEKLRMGSMQSVSQILDSMKPMAVAASSSVYNPQDGTFKQAPAAPTALKETDLQLNYKAAKDQGFVGTIFDYEKKLKEAGRAPAQPPQPQPPVAVVGPDGREIYVTREEALKNRMSPAGKVTALTESQGNATAFGMRMKESHAALKDLESKGETGTGVIRGTVGGVVGLAPFVGDKFTAATDDIFNVLPSILGGMSPEQQKVLNGRINFITAVLRKESGAAISPGEFVTAEKLYFPKPGDDATVVKQKQRARELAIKAMEIQAGPGAKSIQSLTPGTSGASSSDPLGLFNK